MPVDILVPPLSQTLDTLVLVEWLVNVGDPVHKGQPIFTVETDKATLEVESPAAGVLESISARPGDEVQVRTVIGRIQESLDGPAPVGATTRIFASPRARHLLSQKGLSLEALDGSGTGPQGMIVERDVRAYLDRHKQRATPLARRMAQHAGLDLASLPPAQGAQPIRKADIKAVLESASAPPEAGELETDRQAPVRGVPLSNIRQTIAARMSESHHSTAPVTYLSEVDATRLVKLRQRILEQIDPAAVPPTLTDFIVRITALVLGQHPHMNATFDGQLLHLSESIHIALAVDTDRGLLVPVIRDAGQLGLAGIAQARSLLVHKAMQAELKPDEMTGGTFTISNLGTLGIDHFTPIINPPQVAILGVGRLRQVPAIRKGKLRQRYAMGLSVTADHRIIDGAPAARFLRHICRLVEEPGLIWL